MTKDYTASYTFQRTRLPAIISIQPIYKSVPLFYDFIHKDQIERGTSMYHMIYGYARELRMKIEQYEIDDLLDKL